MVVPGFLLVNAGCVLIFFSFFGLSELGRARWLVYLGKISYGLYAFHWGVLIFWRDVLNVVARRMLVVQALAPVLQVVLGLVTTVVLAAGSYRFFERPILRLKQRFEVIHTRAV